MATNYMTKGQYDRHMEQVRVLEDKIAEARRKVGDAAKHGDLSENAEYDAAREEVEFLTTRYQELQGALVGMQIVDPRRTDPRMITIGKKVTLRDRGSGEEFTCNVVGGGWVDPTSKEVSYRAPLAAGLIGRRAGDVVELPVPEGMRTVEVIAVEPYE
jgi:transcription elongation factor GreA